ncbi:asparagine synthase (glutamine-hydrolyzing) [Vicingaceae bacterium]|nr:asparagine synthase (glutamine-hydrolyzing) [Vicingaceae bacterium]
MCGICGIVAFDEVGQLNLTQIKRATSLLEKRGPDAEGTIHINNIALGHRRLSIIDTSANANQPFTDISGRYTIVFNGEIFNYSLLKRKLLNKGVSFETNSDTEVLLYMYIHYKERCCEFVNGFFAFSIYDRKTKSTFLARDRFGIKPLLYYKDKHQFIWSSTLTSLMAFDFSKELDHSSLYMYLQLNYLPQPHSFINSVKKLDTGHYAQVDEKGKIEIYSFYNINSINTEKKADISYEKAKSKLIDLLGESVEQRMISDVPLGTFLSGGIDSSIISALASNLSNKSINTFSVGYKDEPLFDETNYAEAVANRYQTNHHTFKLTNDDLLVSFFDFLDHIDEPFADSSALVVNILSRETRKFVTVALSGDGADEIFSGYRKHMAEFIARKGGISHDLIGKLGPFLDYLPQSRNSKLGNLFRKLKRFSDGVKLTDSERYWTWAALISEADTKNLLIKDIPTNVYNSRKQNLLSSLKTDDFNEVLLTDVKMVLKSDMLKKVDSMSMHNSLEVRVPYLDHRVVEFAFSLPTHYKIDGSMKKKILQDAGRHLLPAEIYDRAKQGFEVPLIKWFRRDLADLIEKGLLSEDFIKSQNLFNYKKIQELKNNLNSSNPGDSPATIFSLLIFNKWWKKHLS